MNLTRQYRHEMTEDRDRYLEEVRRTMSNPDCIQIMEVLIN